MKKTLNKRKVGIAIVLLLMIIICLIVAIAVLGNNKKTSDIQTVSFAENKPKITATPRPTISIKYEEEKPKGMSIEASEINELIKNKWNASRVLIWDNRNKI